MSTNSISSIAVNPDYLNEVKKIVLPLKNKMMALMQLKEGDKLLDVGCGAAIDTLTLYQKVGPEGRVFGVDANLGMIQSAIQKTIECGLTKQVIHQVGEANNLQFSDNTFDSVRSERMIQHLENPEKAIQEMWRVLKPGGWLVLADTDHSSLSIDTTIPDTQNIFLNFRRHCVKNYYAGRSLYRWLRHLNPSDEIVEPYVVSSCSYPVFRLALLIEEIEKAALAKKVLSLDSLTALNRDWEELNQQKMFFGFIIMIIAAAKKGGKK